MKIPAGKKAIAHHEAGHAVIARVLGFDITYVDITYATLRSLDGGPGEVLRTAPRARGDIEAIEKDAIISLAGPMAQHRYRPLTQSAQKRAWKRGWLGDRSDAENALVTLLMRQHDEPVVLDDHVLEGQRSEELCELFDRTLAKAAGLVQENWSAIERVAAALLRAEAPLGKDEIDAMIAQNDF